MSSSAAALLSRLTDFGATVSVNGDRLRIEAPSALPDSLLAGLRERKAEILPLARVLSLPLDQFAWEGPLLEVRVPWFDATLWMVPADRDASQLMAVGVGRGRIWTAAELMQVMAIADRTPEVVKTVMHAKAELDGEITEVMSVLPGPSP
jgi:hypothetical protein